MARLTGVKGDVAIGAGQRILDQGTGKAQPAILAEHGAGAGHPGDATGGRVGKPDLFERIERCVMDAVHRLGAEGLVEPAFETGADRAEMVAKWGGAAGAAGGAATGAAGGHIVHGWRVLLGA